MKEYYQRWLTAIEQSGDLFDCDKQSYLDMVLDLAETGAPVILNMKHLALLIGIDYRVLKRMAYSRNHFYRSFSILKRSGGERLIEASYPSLMMVQRWIYDNILVPTAVIHRSSVGFTPGKTICDNARPHIGNGVLLKMDVKDFFPSVKESLVEEYFFSLGYNRSISQTLAYLCCKNGKLPQGAPTSPMLSNVLFYNMDKELAELAVMQDMAYTRYADDITFSGRAIPLAVIGSVMRIVGGHHLVINKEKTRRSGPSSRKIVTGVSVSSGRMTIPRERKRDIRQRVHYILTYGLADHLKHIESRDLLAGYRLLGELAYWHSVEPENQYVITASSRLREML